MWTYKGKEVDNTDIEGYASFVYLIVNLTNNKRYIGKKNFESIRTKKVKGKSRRKRTRTESDWRNYFGSSDSLLADVAILGEQNFTREILHLCKTRGTASYLEMKEQVVREVLEKDGWYNEQIRARVHRSHIKL